MANQAKFGETQFSVGDTVVVHQKIIEGKKERATTFEGIVISVRGKGENKTFTVRRIATGEIGVERIWPLSSPWISKIKVIKKGKVRRAKLYYLKRRAGKKAIKIKAKNDGVKRGQNRVERDEKKPRRPRRKSRLKTSKK